METNFLNEKWRRIASSFFFVVESVQSSFSQYAPAPPPPPRSRRRRRAAAQWTRAANGPKKMGEERKMERGGGNRRERNGRRGEECMMLPFLFPPERTERERKGSSLNLRCNNPFENRLRLRWPFAAVRPSQWPSTTATQNPPLPFVSDAIGPPPFSKGEEVHFKWRLPFRLEKDISTVLICTFVLETFFLLHEVPANVWWLCSFSFICFGKKNKSGSLDGLFSWLQCERPAALHSVL